MFDITKAKVGDSCNYYPLDLMGYILAYGGLYSHTSTISKIEGSKVTIIESHIDSGVVEKELNPKWYNSIDVRRIDMSNSQIEKVIEFQRSKIGCGYGLVDFPDTIWGLFFGHRGKPSSLNDPNLWYCTELRSCSIASVGLQSVNGIDPHRTIPSDLGSKKSNEYLVC